MKHNLVFYYSGSDRSGFQNDYEFALAFIMSHHSFISALGGWKGKICLVTDKSGVELIVNQFGLHFDEVTVIEDSFSMRFSAMKKYGFNPFIIIDIGTFLLKTFPIKALRGQLFCDYFVRNNPIDLRAFDRCAGFLRENDLVELIKRTPDSIWSLETGIVGQDGLGRWWDYSSIAEHLILNHGSVMEATDNQFHFKRMIENILPYYYFKDREWGVEQVIDRNKETDFEYFHHQVVNFNFIRLFGKSKQNPFLIEAVEKFVKRYYPESYTKIKHLK
jgi:hypothetical protein